MISLNVPYPNVNPLVPWQKSKRFKRQAKPKGYADRKKRLRKLSKIAKQRNRRK